MSQAKVATLTLTIFLPSFTVCALAVFAGDNKSPVAILVPSGAVVPSDDSAGNTPGLAASFPDKFAWMLFTTINQKAPQQGPVGGVQGNPQSNDALWETWADDPQTFPDAPNPAQKPQWPTPTKAKRSKKLFRRALTPKVIGQKPSLRLESVHVPIVGPNKNGEEVHRNQVAFDYIINNDLWYQEGIATFFSKAANAVGDDVAFTAASVNFPRASIEVKANWIAIDPKDKDKYHWNYNYIEGSNGSSETTQLLGLVAMHIISKDLPNWMWCTFEHIDNKGRGDYIGIHDSFGADPAHTPSNADTPATIYPAETLTPAVLAMFETSGMNKDQDWGKRWRNYRLKGSQIDFTDSNGRPLLLGNSVTEDGFVQSASCITCHARAAVTSCGAKSFPVFGEKATLPLAVSGADTYNGVPDPNWYFLETGKMTTLLNLQTDFVWAIPMRAQSANGTQ
ncbi:MAG TPA: hypothetical protein VHV55_20720 [Pirellulales bacterium]|jgi:hypothetical protein|nr:hypothetical protein [Pirellulales bacterium]